MIEVNLHKAIVTTLKASPELTAIIGNKVWEETPPKNSYPFVFVGDMSIETSSEDIYSFDVDVAIQAYSNHKNVSEILTMSGHIRETLDQAFDVQDFEIAENQHMNTVFPNNADSLKQAIITLRFKLFRTA